MRQSDSLDPQTGALGEKPEQVQLIRSDLTQSEGEEEQHVFLGLARYDRLLEACLACKAQRQWIRRDGKFSHSLAFEGRQEG